MQTFRRADFAWEFLRRNEGYRRAAMASTFCGEAGARPWGLQFFADPMADASAAQVFWCPETAPTSVVWLRPSAGSSGLPLSSSADVIAQRRTVEGLHLRLRGGLQVYVEGGDPSAPLAAMIPIAGSFSAALKGARDLDRILSGGVISEDLTLQQQVRLRRSLIALDAVQAQATYRQIAVQIFGPEAVARYDWRTSSIRDAAIRLVRTGRAMADGGYMRLLGGASS